MASGSIQPRGEGKWRLVITLARNPITGRYPQITRTVHGKKKDAERVARQLLDEHDGATTRPNKTTVANLCDQWLAHITARGRSTTTTYNYRNRIERDIKPRIGNLDVRKLSVRDLDDLYTRMGKQPKGGSPASIRQVHAIIRAALNYAMKRDLVTRNVATLMGDDLPAIRRKPLQPPTPAEVMLILDTAYQLDRDLGMALRLAATTGARRGSIAAVRYPHLDFTNRTVTIERSIAAIPGQPIQDKDLKAGRGGPVPVDVDTMRMLEEHVAHLHARAQLAGTELVDDFYLFSSRADGATPARPDALTTGFGKVRKLVGLPHVRLHDLRHFVPTVLGGAGFDAVTLAGRLHHASAKMTLDTYSHVISERAREAGDAMGELLRKRENPTS